MSPASTAPDERARKMQSFVLQRLSGKQSNIATVLGVSESTVSRWKSEQLELCCLILAHAGIKTVSVELRCYNPKEVDAFFRMFKGQINRARSVDDVLVWDE